MLTNENLDDLAHIENHGGGISHLAVEELIMQAREANALRARAAELEAELAAAKSSGFGSGVRARFDALESAAARSRAEAAEKLRKAVVGIAVAEPTPDEWPRDERGKYCYVAGFEAAACKFRAMAGEALEAYRTACDEPQACPKCHGERSIPYSDGKGMACYRPCPECAEKPAPSRVPSEK